jgi:RNA 3'-terminal phosphate cyclase (ATP)
VLQTVLPALLTADGHSELILEGGTHNPYAPPFDFLDKAFLPLVNRMGAAVTTGLLSCGWR